MGGLTEEALHDLTGGLPVSHDLAKLRDRPDAMWKDLLTMKKEQSVMGCAMHAAAKMNIIPFHAYGIVKAVELKVPGQRQPVRIVHLRNPWGSGEARRKFAEHLVATNALRCPSCGLDSHCRSVLCDPMTGRPKWKNRLRMQGQSLQWRRQ